MNQFYTIMIMMLAIVAFVGIIVESVDAWHTQFTTKDECNIFMQYTLGNSSLEASKMCGKIIPHE
jgi:hypothetical protein